MGVRDHAGRCLGHLARGDLLFPAGPAAGSRGKSARPRRQQRRTLLIYAARLGRGQAVLGVAGSDRVIESALATAARGCQYGPWLIPPLRPWGIGRLVPSRVERSRTWSETGRPTGGSGCIVGSMVARTSSAGRIGTRGRRAVAERDPVDQLFTVGPSEFVQRRNALTKALRDAGRSREAGEVERLRRPSPAVWLANRLARQDPEGVTRFIDAVERLKRAHLGRGDLVQATESQRNALERLLAEARAIQMDAATPGVPRGAMGRLSATLVGAAADEDQRAQLAQGRLTRAGGQPGGRATRRESDFAKRGGRKGAPCSGDRASRSAAPSGYRERRAASGRPASAAEGAGGADRP
jgi:hypothetical protein